MGKRSSRLVLVYEVQLFFFKKKTAYEMRISDWSSDVCSSDRLRARRVGAGTDPELADGAATAAGAHLSLRVPQRVGDPPHRRPRGGDVSRPGGGGEIGRATCRERVCKYV